MDSVVERIMQHLETTLKGVTVGNGYANTIHTVQRVKADGQESVTGNGVHIIQGEDAIKGVWLNGEHDLLSRRLHVDLVIVAQSDVDVGGRTADSIMNSLEADCRKAVQVDVSRGGLAVTTDEDQAGELDVQVGMPELRRVLGFAIRYRHRRTDPTIAG